MDYKKVKTETSAVTRKMFEFTKGTNNIYETVAAISKRSNQISVEIKEELNRKIAEFSPSTDNLEEIFENREQIEISKYYEHLPKANLIAIHEFLNDQIYIRNPLKDPQ